MQISLITRKISISTIVILIEHIYKSTATKHKCEIKTRWKMVSC